MTQDNNTGHQPITVLFTHYGENWIRGSERCLLDLITHLDKTKFKAILWCNHNIMESEAKTLGIDVYRSDFPLLFGWQQPRFNIAAFVELVQQAVQLIDKHNIKLMHANSAAPCQWLNLAAYRRSIPVVSHLHSNYQLRDRLTLGLYQAAMVVGVSQFVLNDLLLDRMPSERTCIIANGIDTARLQQQTPVDLRHLLKIDRDDFIIATVGSLIHRKGIDLIIAAVPLLLAQGIPLQLVIIGDGPEMYNLKLQIIRLGLQKNVTLLGEKNNVIALLQGGADLFVSAAREEAFGLVFAEASLAKIGIVAPDVGGISDVVIDGETGILVPPENINALADAIHKLYLKPALRSSMGKAGHQHILTHFSIQKNCQKFEQLYSKILNIPAPHAPWYKNWPRYFSLVNGCKRFIIRKVI